MKLKQSFKRCTAGRWHIVWRSLRADGSEDLSSNGTSFVYVGHLDPSVVKARLDQLMKSQAWKPDVYLIGKQIEAMS